jgi:hypothetical protein
LTITRPVKLDVAAAALGTRHAKMLSKLVFPHPVGPMMASNSPLSVFPLTLFRMGFFFITLLHGFDFVASFTSIEKETLLHSNVTFPSSFRDAAKNSDKADRPDRPLAKIGRCDPALPVPSMAGWFSVDVQRPAQR